jgi:hypothetical protein
VVARLSYRICEKRIKVTMSSSLTSRL